MGKREFSSCTTLASWLFCSAVLLAAVLRASYLLISSSVTLTSACCWLAFSCAAWAVLLKASTVFVRLSFSLAVVLDTSVPALEKEISAAVAMPKTVTSAPTGCADTTAQRDFNTEPVLVTLVVNSEKTLIAPVTPFVSPPTTVVRGPIAAAIPKIVRMVFFWDSSRSLNPFIKSLSHPRKSAATGNISSTRLASVSLRRSCDTLVWFARLSEVRAKSPLAVESDCKTYW